MAVFGQQTSPLPTFSARCGFLANQPVLSSSMADYPNQQNDSGPNRKRPLVSQLCYLQKYLQIFFQNPDIMDEIDGPTEKKRFEQFSDEFSNFNLNSPIINEIEDDG
jgi:hypothetical protein